jgi:hypothetical protein
LFREKVKKKLNRKASKPDIFKVNLKRFTKIPTKRISPFSGVLKGTDTYCWKLETTGASDSDSETIRTDNPGRIYNLIFTFPAGSEFGYYIKISRNEGRIFPSKLSNELRGDNQVKSFDVDLPFMKHSDIKIEMISNADLKTNVVKACWVDISLRYD